MKPETSVQARVTFPSISVKQGMNKLNMKGCCWMTSNHPLLQNPYTLRDAADAPLAHMTFLNIVMLGTWSLRVNFLDIQEVILR
jgi:hypothetical protein